MKEVIFIFSVLMIIVSGTALAGPRQNPGIAGANRAYVPVSVNPSYSTVPDSSKNCGGTVPPHSNWASENTMVTEDVCKSPKMHYNKTCWHCKVNSASTTSGFRKISN